MDQTQSHTTSTKDQSKANHKKVLVETWGCQMNVADSERMLGILTRKNFIPTQEPDTADLIILNTCNIREKARHKVLSRLGRLKEFKKQNPNLKIAVTGCIPEMERNKLLRLAPEIDILIGPGQLDSLYDLVTKNEITEKPVVSVGFDEIDSQPTDLYEEGNEFINPVLTGKNNISRFVNIIQGCENFCTYCVVPYARGKERSRSIPEIENEIKSFIKNGTKEITLLGQNVNNFGLDLAKAEDGVTPFVTLLQRLLKIPGLDRLKFTTSNPYNFTKELAQLFASESAKLGRHIHLPVQSGNNQILKAMNRKITAEEYLEKISWLREVDQEMAISTDLIVGFPGETEEQFEDTLKLLDQAQYSFVYAFKYSPREGTPAAKFKDQVPEDVKERRLARLLEKQDEITTEQNRSEIGKKRKVLFLYQNPKDNSSFYGRTDHFRLVKVWSKEDLTGKLLDIEITSANKTALEGKLI